MFEECLALYKGFEMYEENPIVNWIPHLCVAVCAIALRRKGKLSFNQLGSVYQSYVAICIDEAPRLANLFWNVSILSIVK